MLKAQIDADENAIECLECGFLALPSNPDDHQFCASVEAGEQGVGKDDTDDRSTTLKLPCGLATDVTSTSSTSTRGLSGAQCRQGQE